MDLATVYAAGRVLAAVGLLVVLAGPLAVWLGDRS